MVQHCVNAASTDFGISKQLDAADVVGSKTSSMNNTYDHHLHTLGSMQAGSVDFVTNVLPNSTRLEQGNSSSSTSYKTNTTISSTSSSSGYGSVLSKSHKSLFTRLKRLINFPTTRKSIDYRLSTKTKFYDENCPNSPILSFKNPNALTMNQNSNETRRKSSKKNLLPSVQHIPFLYGLKNCGNTCYINAILQCLCHTEQIASYILHKTYEIDMRNIKNALTDNAQPINFKVTKIFIQIFQTLWTNSSNTTSKLLYDFKTIIANLNKQYSGNEQNDAQEFLLFLVNTIHDELNLSITRRNRQSTNSSSSELAARRAWLEYVDANQSLITETFSGQLHSTLRCNQCKKESKTFEPYLFLSLPIPQKILKPVIITVVFLNQSPKQLQIGLCLPITNTVKDVRDAIAQQSNLDPNDLALIEIHPQNGYSQVFHDSEPITRLTEDVYAIQFPPSPSSPPAETTEQSASNTEKSYINILVYNRVRYTTGRQERFGTPIAIRVLQQSDYRTLQLAIIKAQRSFLRDEILDYAQDYVVVHLTLIDQYQPTSRQEYPIYHDAPLPLYADKILEILETYNGTELGPAHIQVYASWPEKYLEEFLSKWSNNDDKPDIHQSVLQARAILHQPTSSLISLADCFSLFTQSESLNYDDAWMCTHCRRKENGTVKNLKIWTTPPVLIIHLKRFCQTKSSNSKLTYPVQFPLTDLNVKKCLSTTSTNTNDEHEDFIENDHDDDDNQRHYGIYDLFAVCNHRGSMSNGHYTAYCKNPVTGKWFCYDDHLVSELDPSRVCTPDAYILFYKRRDIPSPSSSQQQQIDSIVNEFDEQLNIDYQSSNIEDKKPSPLPRKFLTSQDDCSPKPCPMPRTRLPQSTSKINSNTDIINPWNRLNNQKYSNDETETNLVHNNTTTLR